MNACTRTRRAAALFAFAALFGSAAQAAPNFQMPFPCGQVWSGQTRTNHSPQNSVDFNRANDEGDTVVAAAAGTVSVVRNLGDTSYGKYVVIDHGGGWSSLYAHLNSYSVSVGQSVASGKSIGTVGSTGGFLRRGNTTILTGVPAEQADEAASLIEATCRSASEGEPREGGIVFALDVDWRMRI